MRTHVRLALEAAKRESELKEAEAPAPGDGGAAVSTELLEDLNRGSAVEPNEGGRAGLRKPK